MAVSKILYDGVGIDLTADTVDAAHLAQGYTAHDRNGDIVTGTMTSGSGGGIPEPNPITAGVTPVWCDMTMHSNNAASGNSVYSYTCKKPGTYRIYAPVSANNSSCIASLRKNGTEIKTASWEGVNNKRAIIQEDVTMSAGDNITVYIKGGSTMRGVTAHGLIICIDWDNGF